MSTGCHCERGALSTCDELLLLGVGLLGRATLAVLDGLEAGLRARARSDDGVLAAAERVVVLLVLTEHGVSSVVVPVCKGASDEK